MARGAAAAGGGGRPRLPNGQRRMLTILSRIAPAREQLLAAIEDLSPVFALDALVAAAESADPRERNQVDTIERGTEKLVNWMDELAARALAERVRLGALAVGEGGAFAQLARLGVISRPTSERLREAKDVRDDLAHAYPPQSYAALHDATSVVISELDSFVACVTAWAVRERVLPDASGS